MTSIIAWAGMDATAQRPNRQTSLYIATDSRITTVEGVTWDASRKLFASTRTADILAYAGNDLFPLIALSHVETLLNRGILVGDSPDANYRNENIFEVLQEAAVRYPFKHSAEFTIIHAARHASRKEASFCLWERSYRREHWEPARRWQMPDHSGIIETWGKGADQTRAWYEQLLIEDDGRRTSRTVFRAFCQALDVGGDDSSAGPPQLAGLWRLHPAGVFGIVHEGKRYLGGVPIRESGDLRQVIWFNHEFRKCDPYTLQPL